MNWSTEPVAKPPFWVGFVPCLICVAFYGWMRLWVFHDRVFPLTSALPLLLSLWHRDKRLLYGMAVVLSAISFVKVWWVLPDGEFSWGYEQTVLISNLINIWLVAFTVHGLLSFRSALEGRNSELGAVNRELDRANRELAASNEELAAREEDILNQHEELQSQTEELEQQWEELRQQAEELEQKGTEMHELNRELLRREKGLETLLDSGRWMRSDMSEAYVMSGVCQAALQILPEDIAAADVAAACPGAYEVLGDCGFGLQGRMQDGLTYENSFAAIAIESGRTAAVENIALRPDVRLPGLRAGRAFHAVLAAPIWYEGEPVAALCAYSVEPREWTEHDFAVVEWLAAQAALALQSIRVQRELEVKRREAEDAAIQKSKFLAAVSHDVRTPANAISLLAELIDRAASDPRAAERVPGLARNLWSNAKALVDLVSDVLDLTRLDSGKSDLHVTEFPLHELIQAEVFQAKASADRRGIKVEAVLPDEPVTLATDRMKLKRILSNLMGNAVKFTEQGGVKVECTVQGDKGLKIAVTDTGVGIPAESLAHVFDEFHQLRNPERNRDKGAGLGLAICRRLATSLGATISLESEVGKGSRFELMIPPRLLAKPAVESSGAVPDLPEGRLLGMQILLVEDNDVARNSIAELLATEGAIVTALANGRDALASLDGGVFQALLLDLNLPDLDGCEILQRLSVSRPEALKKIVVISGDARPERYDQVKQLGADELLAKPVSLARVRSAILS